MNFFPTLRPTLLPLGFAWIFSSFASPNDLVLHPTPNRAANASSGDDEDSKKDLEIPIRNYPPLEDWTHEADIKRLAKDGNNYRIDGGMSQQDNTWTEAYAWVEKITALDEKVIEPIEDALCSREANRSVLITGEDTQLVKIVFARLAYRADYFAANPEEDNRPCFNRSDFEIDITRIEAGNHLVGSVRKHLLSNIIVPALKLNTVLYISDLGDVIGLGSHSHKATGIETDLTRFIRNGSIKMVAFANTGTYNVEVNGNNKALITSFKTRIQLPEIKGAALKEILQNYIAVRPHIKDKFAPEDMSYLETMGKRLLLAKQEPDRSLDVIDWLVRQSEKRKNPIAFPIFAQRHLRTAIGKVGNVPEWIVDRDWTRLASYENSIGNLLIGQRNALQDMSRLLETGYAMEHAKSRPVAKVLYVGPTGTGKTYLAEETAKHLELPLLTFDMTQYPPEDPESYPNFVKALGDALKSTPFAVYNFEEIDKASPGILKKLYFFLDEGKFYDSKQRLLSSTGAFVVATTNAGSEVILEKKDDPELQNLVEEDLENPLRPVHFAPAFIARFDRISVFKPFSGEEYLALAKVITSVRAKQYTPLKKYKLEFDPAAIEFIGRYGHSPKKGARPMERLVDSLLNGVGRYEIYVAKFDDKVTKVRIQLKDASKNLFTVIPDGGMKPYDYVPQLNVNGNNQPHSDKAVSPTLSSPNNLPLRTGPDTGNPLLKKKP